MPAEQLDEPVVAAATAERLLAALTTGNEELEGRPGVVVEAADEARLDAVGDAERIEVLADRREMDPAGLAQQVA